MRFGITLAGILVLCVLGLISALHGPLAVLGFLPKPAALMVGALVFVSCVTGMVVAHIEMSNLQAEKVSAQLGLANADLEHLIVERTQALSVKVQELETARAEAVEANAAKSRFLATMSHELRTPLNAILGFSEIIQRELYGPLGNGRYGEYAQHIHQSGGHLLSLIGDILDLSKIEAGKMELQCEPLDVADVVNEAIRLAGKRSAVSGHAISVLVEDKLPLLYADRRATVQMLLNLLSNAMKFTPPDGAIAVTAGVLPDGGIALNVRDTGVGMAKEDIPKALADYGQVLNAEVRKHAGTGLGLPIVNAMMELHGGMLNLDSEKDRGTRVSLWFPPERSLRRDAGALAA